MKPEQRSKKLLNIIRAKEKFIEFNIPEKDRILQTSDDPEKLFLLAIGLIADIAYAVNTDSEISHEIKENVLFSAHFLESFSGAQLHIQYNTYNFLLGAATYYLCDIPGCAKVLINKLAFPFEDLQCSSIDLLLFHILKDELKEQPKLESSFFPLQRIWNSYVGFFSGSVEKEKIYDEIQEFHSYTYRTGNSRELLFCEIVCAVIRKKIKNSIRTTIAGYSALPLSNWDSYLKKANSLKEFWPAQHLLGTHGVFTGKSAVIQMPTSAGKTKSTEFIIRSAFLSERTEFVVIVAPFKALCHEIKNTFRYAFQSEKVLIDDVSDDFIMTPEGFLSKNKKSILIFTPEKLYYILKHNTDLIAEIGLIIYDEAHQFDNSSRGITYELLLTAINMLIGENAQKILISAVLSNIEQIAAWFAPDAEIIKGGTLLPTFKSVGFFQTPANARPQIKYIDKNMPDNVDSSYFVPRVIAPIRVGNTVFPDSTEKKDTAIYLTHKLYHNGSVVIFNGKKNEIVSFCKYYNSIQKKFNNLLSFDDNCDTEQLGKLVSLYTKNLGIDSETVKSACHGLFSHHNSIPQGLRYATEYAMEKKYINCLICTSTLAQGVNLPIKYLIVLSSNLGGTYLKIRDFHNLIGRVSRADKHTEGSILFADSTIVSNKRSWYKTKEMLNADNTEECVSTLLDLVKPDMLPFNRANIAPEQETKLQAIESFLLNFIQLDDEETPYIRFCQSTLAYSLATDEQKKALLEIFKEIYDKIQSSALIPEQITAYGKTLYGIDQNTEIYTWLSENIENIQNCGSDDELSNVFVPYLIQILKKEKKISDEQKIHKMIHMWLNGETFHTMFIHMQGCMWGGRHFTIEHIVNITESILNFKGCLFVSAVSEMFELFDLPDQEKNEIKNKLTIFQKRLKYGLPDISSIILYQMGFCDRVLAQELSSLLPEIDNYEKARGVFQTHQDDILNCLKKYPACFENEFCSYMN